MHDSETIGRIQQLCAARNWTVYRLSKESGITYSTLCTMLHKASAPSIPTLVKLCNGFGITLSEFFDTGNAQATLTAEQKSHLLLWNSLSDKNKQATEQFMRFLLEGQNKNRPDEP